jgi:hypothetical protein
MSIHLVGLDLHGSKEMGECISLVLAQDLNVG